MFFFCLSSPGSKGRSGFFFKHFVFKLEMDGWFFGSKKKTNNLGRVWLVAWDFSHLPNGWERVPFKTPPIGGCWLVLLFSLLLNFSGVVLKKFREGSLIFGGQEDPKNHSTASCNSNS